MIARDVIHAIREQIAERVYIRPFDTNAFAVSVPVLMDDGDPCGFVLSQPRGSGEWVLHDDGGTFRSAELAGVDLLSTALADRFKKLLEFHGLEEKDGELSLHVREGDFADAIFSFTQLRIEAANLAKFRKERAEPTTQPVVERLGNVLSKHLPASCFQANWSHPEFDEHRLYPVDYHIASGSGEEWLFFGVGSQEACWKAATSCWFLKSNKVDFKSAAAWDHRRKIAKRAKTPLLTLLNKSFPELDDPGVISFIESLAP